MYGDTLGSNVGLAIYATFTIFCFLAPPIVNKWGGQTAMFFGILCYAVLVAASLFYFETDANAIYSPVVIIAGCILGFGASLLWTAQGRLMLQYSTETNSGQLFSVFWGWFNAAAVVGGLVTFLYFSETDSNVRIVSATHFVCDVIAREMLLYTLGSCR